MRPLRRLYSTFAGGWPGLGLILMRFSLGAVLASSAACVDLNNLAVPMTIFCGLGAIAAIFLIVGLYTPIVGMLVAIVEGCRAVTVPPDRLVCFLLATFSAALAMLGPGFWSIDARLFGWKRIEPSPRKR